MQPDVIGGRYRVGSAIGQGGMGTVWLCRDETLHRDVAVKQVGMMPGESVTDSARALREARSSAALSHRNVVTVFDVIEQDSAVWLVMEHVPSRSLYDIVQQDGPLSPAVVADIGAQVADGLAAAHAAGTMHRDVKPGNVLVREDGVAKISDFGIARNAGDPALTASGFLTGTPSYFSPELARGAAPSPAADVWALGATLYAAVEGHPPYRPQRNPVAVLHEIASSQPPRPARAEFLEPVLLRMMDRDPDSRWSMADAAHGLHQLARRHSPENTRENTRPSTLESEPAAVPPVAAAAAADVPASAATSSGPTTEAAAAGPADRSEAPAQAAPPTTPPTTPDTAPHTAPSTPGRPPASRPPERRGSPWSRGRSRRRGLGVLLAVLVLLLVAVVGFFALRGGPGGSDDTAGGSPSASSSASSKGSPSGSRSSTSSPSSGGSGSTSSGSGSGGSQEAFLRDYYAAAPGGTDAGWSRLGPGEKAQGRASYDGFWRTIDSVDVADVRPVDKDSVEVTLTYHKRDGATSRERQRVDLVRSPDGGYLINNDEPAG